MDFGLLVCVDKGCYHSFYFLLLLFSLIAVSVPLRGKYRGELLHNLQLVIQMQWRFRPLAG